MIYLSQYKYIYIYICVCMCGHSLQAFNFTQMHRDLSASRFEMWPTLGLVICTDTKQLGRSCFVYLPLSSASSVTEECWLFLLLLLDRGSLLVSCWCPVYTLSAHIQSRGLDKVGKLGLDIRLTDLIDGSEQTSCVQLKVEKELWRQGALLLQGNFQNIYQLFRPKQKKMA